jgi:diguanylate cyclase (GGDEF)-like protein/PAS domain S-box-containing protein
MPPEDRSPQPLMSETEAGRPLTVLLVEDHTGVAELLREILHEHGILRVGWVQTLAAALDHLRAAPVDVVLLDLGLPDSQGLDTVTRVVQAHPALPVIVLTARGHEEGLSGAALKAGAEDYIAKGTIEPNTLVRAIRYACERKRAEAALRESHEYTNQVIQSVQDGIVVYDRHLRHQVWNPAMEALSGVRAAAVVGRPAGEAPGAWGEAVAVSTLRRALAGDVVSLPEISYRIHESARDGWLAATFGPLRDGRGAIIGVIGSVRDITLRKEAEEVLWMQSLVDELTGLHNRRGFLVLAGQCLRLAERNRTEALLVFADLDGLKAVNDTRGHGAGDQALRDTAAVLRRSFRTSDVLARFGGDEFAVLVLDTGAANRHTVLARLDSSLRAHNASAARPLSLSVGVAAYDRSQRCSVEDLLARADAAMYAQKSQKKQAGSPAVGVTDDPSTGTAAPG